MTTAQIIHELSAINQRITRLELELKALNYNYVNNSNSKIDYLSMMTEITMKEEDDYGSI